jgi:hypothetical protein
MNKYSEQALKDFYNAIKPALIRIAMEERTKKETESSKRSDRRND